MYVDDATSRLMELAFAEVESTFDDFRATRRYLEGHGKPMAFYSDRLSVFHVAKRDVAQGGPGISQFGRAPRALNIDSICATSAAAKGRVERANQTLQDRLIKELRLRGLNDPATAEAFLPEFMADYNAWFAVAPRVAYDAHRPLRPEEDLRQIFTLQEPRRISRELTGHYKRDLNVLEDSVTTRRLRGATALVCEAADGSVPARLFPKDHAQLAPGAVVAHRHLGAALNWIAERQQTRNVERLSNGRLRVRERRRVQAGGPVRKFASAPA